MDKDMAKKREDEWFARHEKELLEAIRREREKRIREKMEQIEEQKRRELKELHWMKCPKCGNDMVEIELEGIHVDQCTVCEGIFFDRGELEMLFLQREEQKRPFFRRLLGL